MKFTLDAATNVTLRGKSFVHAWINHQFSDSIATEIKLAARSGPYSSYILMLGNIHAVDSFHPTHAIIVKSKDLAVDIPLILEHIPSAKAFRDATESISPEMKEFASAYRSMQLESTLFGLCIVQIKPQMERLLNLPEDSLTKEIELTEDLQDLFIRYQIPSDLLSYDGPKDALVSVQIDRVKHLVNEMKVIIAEMKTDELKEVKQQAVVVSSIPQVTVTTDYLEDEEEEIEEPTPRRRKKRRKSFTKLLKRAVSRERVYYESPQLKPKYAKSKKKKGKRRDYCEGDSPAHTEVLDAEPDKQEEPNTPRDAPADAPAEENIEINVTQLPAQLDRNFETLDTDAALRSSIIKVGDQWKKTHQPSFLTDPKELLLHGDSIRDEKNKAFDLLDALSKSGVLDIDNTSFHVVLASTHSFDDTLMDTLIRRNVNPIAKVERSALIVASTIHKTPAKELIQLQCLDKVQETSPQLF